MRTQKLVLFIVAVIVAGSAAAGSLDPPGVPAPTGKTLHVVEPRTPIHTLGGSATAIYAITEPGSYYFAHNVYGLNNMNGIEITANNVTIDLMGFSLVGVPGSLDGIKDESFGLTGLTVRNGVIHDWDENGINFHGSDDVLIEDLVIADCEGWGFLSQSGIAIVKDSQFTNNLVGVDIMGGSIIRCIARNNEGAGAQIGGGTSGVVREFVSIGNGSGLSQGSSGGWVIEDSSFGHNQGAGVSLCYGNIVRNNNFYYNGRDAGSTDAAVYVRCGGNLVEGNLIAYNDIGVQALSNGGEVVIRNIFSNNGTTVDASTGNDFAPLEKAATSTNPWANISN